MNQNRFQRSLWGLALFCFLPACGKPEAAPKSKQTGASRSLDFFGGHAARVVWIRQISTNKNSKLDAFGRDENYRLMAWSPEEGERQVLPGLGNYSRPLLADNGQWIIYTDRTMSPPEMHAVDWSGKQSRRLGTGTAVSVTRDPATGQTWIQALSTLNADNDLAQDGEDLIQFPLSSPGDRKQVWSAHTLAIDNIQFSRDGQCFVGLFRWPDARLGVLGNGEPFTLKLVGGCCPSIAPDNSRVAWVFDGTHRKLKFYAPEPEKRWKVVLAKAPGCDSEEMYHPRWSNHPLYFAITGPYPKKKGSNPIQGKGAAMAEVLIGKFSPDLQKMDSWLKITDNKAGDFYPDLWIKGCDDATLEGFTQKPKMAPIAASSDASLAASALFLWDAADSQNTLPGRHMSCRAQAHGIGRYGFRKEMILDGGWFAADEATNTALRKQLPKANALSLTFTLGLEEQAAGGLVGLSSDASGPQALSVRWQDGLAVQAGDSSLKLPLELKAGATAHIGLSFTGKELQYFINGSQHSTHQAAELDYSQFANASLTFGEAAASYRACLSQVGLYGKALSAAEMAEVSAKAAEVPIPPQPLRTAVKAKLLSATEPDLDSLGAYTRMIVDHTYEVIESAPGFAAGSKVTVLHWGILDRKPVPGIPRELAQEYLLQLESAEGHLEISSELQIIDSPDLEAALWLDVSRPALP